MQYGLEVQTYKRSEEKKKRRPLLIREIPINVVSVFLVSLFVSRVAIYIDLGDSTGVAPFGLAILVAIIMRGEGTETLSSTLGVILGYLTINTQITNSIVYVLSALVLMIYDFMVQKFKMKEREVGLFTLVMATYLVCGIIINGYTLGVNITLAIVNTVIVIPIYYVTRYAIQCFEELESSYFFTTEEMISMSIVLCLVVAGIGNLGFFGISLRNVVGLFTVFIISYIAGGAYGAAIGVSMGVIIGISTGNVLEPIGFYGLVGLIVSIFKETGRIFSFLAALVMYIGIALYAKGLNLEGIIEIFLAGGIYLVIPRKVIGEIERELSNEKKTEAINNNRLNQLKEEFGDRVNKLSDALKDISKALEGISSNENLLYKNRSTALVEGLADRVCVDCRKRSTCWEREFNQTYNAFQTVIKSSNGKTIALPADLDKKCVKKLQLRKNTEEVILSSSVNNMVNERLEEGRIVLSKHVKNISNSLDGLILDLNKNITLCNDYEKILMKAFNKNGIKYNEIFCFMDKNGRLRIRAKMDNTYGSGYLMKIVLPVINEISRVPMHVNEELSREDPKNNVCELIFEETPKYHVVSYAAMGIKDGEQHSGDYYSFGKCDRGEHISIISDGMGSGPEAGKESKITVDLTQRLLESGFDEEATINTINSIMGMKFDEEEKYSTLDLSTINVYDGKTSFYKVGATYSFIKRGNKIRAIHSSMPPFGMLDKMDVEKVSVKVKEGDVIISVSDGVVDIDKTKVGNYNWLEDYLQGASSDPKKLASDIIDTAKRLSGGRVKDDMTAVVSKVYSMY